MRAQLLMRGDPSGGRVLFMCRQTCVLKKVLGIIMSASVGGQCIICVRMFTVSRHGTNREHSNMS
jgi:hypothetical protein